MKYTEITYRVYNTDEPDHEPSIKEFGKPKVAIVQESGFGDIYYKEVVNTIEAIVNARGVIAVITNITQYE